MNWNPDVLDRTEKLIYSFRDLYLSSGYERFKMSKFEEYDFYSRNKDFLVSDNIVTFTDTNGKLMALRPDVTLSVIKNCRDSGDSIRRLFYNENVYRTSARGGSFTEIMQTGVECMGNLKQKDITDILLLAAGSLRTISGDYILEICDLDIVSSVIDSMNVSYDVRKDIIRCASNKNLHQIREICSGSGVPDDRTDGLVSLLSMSLRPGDSLDRLGALADIYGAGDKVSGISEIFDAFSAAGYGDRIVLDFSSLGNLNYYNGIFFRGFVNGVPVAVLSGGQYDRLMQKMHRNDRAAGFAVYLNTLDSYVPSGKEDL